RTADSTDRARSYDPVASQRSHHEMPRDRSQGPLSELKRNFAGFGTVQSGREDRDVGPPAAASDTPLAVMETSGCLRNPCFRLCCGGFHGLKPVSAQKTYSACPHDGPYRLL